MSTVVAMEPEAKQRSDINDEKILKEIEKLVVTDSIICDDYQVEEKPPDEKTEQEPVAVEKIIWHITDEDDEENNQNGTCN